MAMNSRAVYPDLVIWTGPVWTGNLAKADWAKSTDILTLSCEGSDNCAAIANNLPATGKLDALLRAHGKTLDQYDAIILGSFSAGHGLSNVLLSDEESRNRIAGFGAFDSYYTGNAPGLKKGYQAFAQLAADGGRYMWTSCSSIPDRKWLSCEDSIKPLLTSVGVSEDTLPEELSSMIKQPTTYVTNGNFVHAFYGTKYKHAEHATIVAPAVLGAWMSQQIHGIPSTSLLQKAGIVVGVAGGIFGAWKLGKWIQGKI